MTPHLYVGSSQQLPDDAELKELTEYVGGFMTEAQAEAFEERLAEDEEFFQRMSPMLDEWYAPGVLPIEIQIAERLANPGIDLRPRLWRRRVTRVSISLALAATLAFLMLQVGKRTVVAPSRVAQQVTPKVVPTVVPTVVSLDAAAPAVKAPVRVAKIRRKAQPAEAPAEVVVFGETAADSALAQSVQTPTLALQTTPSQGPAVSGPEGRWVPIIRRTQQPRERNAVAQAVVDAYEEVKHAGESGIARGKDAWNWARRQARRVPHRASPKPPLRTF